MFVGGTTFVATTFVAVAAAAPDEDDAEDVPKPLAEEAELLLAPTVAR